MTAPTLPSLPPELRDDDRPALERLHARIMRQANAVSLGAAWVGGSLDGASIHACYKFAAVVVRDAITAIDAARATTPEEER